MEQHVADVACFVALFNGASDAPLSLTHDPNDKSL